MAVWRQMRMQLGSPLAEVSDGQRYTKSTGFQHWDSYLTGSHFPQPVSTRLDGQNGEVSAASSLMGLEYDREERRLVVYCDSLGLNKTQYTSVVAGHPGFLMMFTDQVSNTLFFVGSRTDREKLFVPQSSPQLDVSAYWYRVRDSLLTDDSPTKYWSMELHVADTEYTTVADFWAFLHLMGRNDRIFCYNTDLYAPGSIDWEPYGLGSTHDWLDPWLRRHITHDPVRDLDIDSAERQQVEAEERQRRHWLDEVGRFVRDAAEWTLDAANAVLDSAVDQFWTGDATGHGLGVGDAAEWLVDRGVDALELFETNGRYLLPDGVHDAVRALGAWLNTREGGRALLILGLSVLALRRLPVSPSRLKFLLRLGAVGSLAGGIAYNEGRDYIRRHGLRGILDFESMMRDPELRGAVEEDLRTLDAATIAAADKEGLSPWTDGDDLLHSFFGDSAKPWLGRKRNAYEDDNNTE